MSTATRTSSTDQAQVAIRAAELTKEYGSTGTVVRALAGLTLGFERSRFTAVMGPSGSGKSTLLHCMSGLDKPTSGKVFLGDSEITGMSERQLTVLRRRHLGFVFQSFNLVPTLTARENIELPLRLAGDEAEPSWHEKVVAAVGLGDRLEHRPNELSGGQQQRVAVARALLSRPEVVFADEPTGNLDSRTGADVLAFMRKSVDDLGQTIVMVTHDAGAAAHADRVVFLADGQVASELVAPTTEAVLDAMKALTAQQQARTSHVGQ
jgi:putative ABC transport system ATP-binding protein